MDNMPGNEKVPIGFGLALVNNTDAMNYFSSLDEIGRKQVLKRAHEINNKQEMQSFVNNLSKEGFF